MPKTLTETLTDALEKCLEDLESRIDPAEEERLLGDWMAFSEGGVAEGYFAPARRRPAPAGVEWPRVRVNAALEDPDAMALQQYGACSDRLASASGLLLDVRANFGTSILPLLFGVEPFIMADATNTLPTSLPLPDADAVRRIVDAGVPDLEGGYGAQVLDMGRRYADIGGRFPKIAKHVHVYHPDLQGPLDICEVVWGSGIFTAFYEDPRLVKELLELMTETYIAFMRAWEKIAPFRAACAPGAAHWGFYHKGAVMLRADSAMNLSPALYEEFSAPYDQRLLDAFGGGAIHFCGRGDHFIESMGRLEGLHAIQMSQPELNDMGVILRHTAARGIPLIGFPRGAAEKAMGDGLKLWGRVQV